MVNFVNNDLKINNFLPLSYANGPGKRAVIWVQGCSLKCPGCYNPDTHNQEGGIAISIENLYDKIILLKDSIEGLTISGGEPLEQAEALAELIQKIRETANFSIIVFTGYEWNELEGVLKYSEKNTNFLPALNRDAVKKIINSIDILIAGRFDAKQKVARHLRGSANKVVSFLNNRYNMKDLENVPEYEVVITAEGKILISGINPPRLNI
jgi:anaerobic ribonucleoside-triphosphate reductase activating protein